MAPLEPALEPAVLVVVVAAVVVCKVVDVATTEVTGADAAVLVADDEDATELVVESTTDTAVVDVLWEAPVLVVA